jgi:uncharacterized membrane protein
MNTLRLINSMICYAIFGALKLNAIVFNSELTKVSNVQAGETFSGKIVLTNTENDPEVVHLQLNDYHYNANGENFFVEPGTLPRSNARWIELPYRQVKVMPHETKEVSYTVRVPDDASLNGSYASTILVESENYVSKAENVPAGAIGLNVKIRYAHQVVTTLGNPKAKLVINARTITPHGDGYRFNVDVANSGDCYLYPKAILKAFDAKGQLILCAESQHTSIMPGNSVRFTMDLNASLSNAYAGFLLLNDDQNHIFGEKFKFDILSSSAKTSEVAP